MIFTNCSFKLCTFCYKSTTSSPQEFQNNKHSKYSVRKFCKLLGRFVKADEREVDLECLEGLDDCNDCDNLIRKFCKVYNKIKLLELELLWKLENLANVMRLADRVPSRVKMVKECFVKVMEDNCPELREDTATNQVCQNEMKSFKDFRMKIIKNCCRGRTLDGLQPRVLLERMAEDNENLGKPLREPKDIENSNVLPISSNAFHEWIMSLAALVFLVMSSSAFEYIEAIQDLTIIDYDEDIEHNLSMTSRPPSSLSSNLDSKSDVGNDFLTGNHDNNLDLLSNCGTTSGIEKVEIKHSPTDDFNIAHINPVKNRNNKNATKKKLKRNKNVKNSTQQSWFHCTLCKTSFLSYGGLRKHKKNAFHRFLKQKTLKICVNFGGKLSKVYLGEDKTNSQATGKNRADHEPETVNKPIQRQRYNLREHKKKPYVDANDDGSYSDTEITNNQPEAELGSNNNTTSSSSDTSDTDDDNVDIKPKISNSWKRTVCPEIHCFKSFLTIKALQTHANLHGTFPCQFCNKSFTYAPDLAYHENQMHTSGLVQIKHEAGTAVKTKTKFKCSRCPQTFFHRLHYMYHFVEKHLNLSTVHSVCSICKYPSNTESLRKHNLRLHFTVGMEPSKIPRCDKCPAYFRLFTQLANHKLKIHDEITDYPPKTQNKTTNRKRRIKKETPNVTPIKCTKCDERFKTLSDLICHLDNVHQETNSDPNIRPFRCSTCVKSFKTKMALKVHEQCHVPKRKGVKSPVVLKELVCSICALKCKSGPELANHEASHQKTSKKYLSCPRCKKYMRRAKYVGHFMIDHLGALQKTKRFQCGICDKQATRLKKHHAVYHKAEASTKIYKCDEDNCKAYFIQAFQLIFHKKRVHNYDALDCKYCEKKFKGKDSLYSHISCVHPEKSQDPNLPMACDRPYCKKRFGTEAELEWHLKFDKHDNESDEKKCKKCGKEFGTKGLLNNHMKTKCADRNSVICQLCGKGFKTKQYLETHLQFHKGPDGYECQCQTCGKKFMDKYMLKDHMTSHSDEKKWICQWCGKKYGYKRSWKSHVLKWHKDEEGLPETKKIDVRNRLNRKGARPGDCVLAGIKK